LHTDAAAKNAAAFFMLAAVAPIIAASRQRRLPLPEDSPCLPAFLPLRL
jgi:hypothetical protein